MRPARLSEGRNGIGGRSSRSDRGHAQAQRRDDPGHDRDRPIRRRLRIGGAGGQSATGACRRLQFRRRPRLARRQRRVRSGQPGRSVRRAGTDRTRADAVGLLGERPVLLAGSLKALSHRVSSLGRTREIRHGTALRPRRSLAVFAARRIDLAADGRCVPERAESRLAQPCCRRRQPMRCRRPPQLVGTGREAFKQFVLAGDHKAFALSTVAAATAGAPACEASARRGSRRSKPASAAGRAATSMRSTTSSRAIVCADARPAVPAR